MAPGALPCSLCWVSSQSGSYLFANTLPDPTSLIPGEYDSSTVPELKSIDLKEETVQGKKRLCRVGVAVTNEDFRRWAIAEKALSLPADVILVEVTIGGVNGPMCHGAGITHKTLSDYVRRLEYVDCHGRLQIVDDAVQIQAAAGTFGILGVVTHITYAVMKPLKEDVGLGVPPIDKDDIPVALRSAWFDAPDADQQLASATTRFNNRAANEYYSDENNTPTYKTFLPNALHFRRGTQNMRVRDIELQIPLPLRKDGPSKPDFSIVQRAWWDIIKLVYKDADVGSDPSSAMRVALEMRLMAPQKGNDLGTLSIEVLTLPDAVADDEWHEFAQRAIDIRMSYGGNTRPHWAQKWDYFKFKGIETSKYLKEVAYIDQIPEFRDMLSKIGKQHGWMLDELQRRFSNELWDKLVYE
ncbi:hypothetical protein P171DRAFT_443269 [Karstenula rhodostoma CBS 690.94]|uniref:FAD-binding PCMH-type domain-containing protein n=1 Tax=Karstenula rhodostoma CBS 690.94 TaxID=1392251 RepID=A0A9P4PKC7_9PLEO|nr:hypothetical protein P171DRAFT_443269 [Karstenula rhodostoma CBS 690.94]